MAEHTHQPRLRLATMHHKKKSSSMIAVAEPLKEDHIVIVPMPCCFSIIQAER